MALFKNRYRIESARLNGYDYHRRGFYFITICTQSRLHYFGTVKDGMAQLTEIGNIAYEFWCGISDHFQHVRVDSVVVMPNHVHGILEIVKEWRGDYDGDSMSHKDAKFCVSTMGDGTNSSYQNRFKPQSGNLYSIIRGYKAGVTTYARNQNIEFAWQPRFHDHIIRNQYEYDKIRDYINTNPSRWNIDCFR